MIETISLQNMFFSTMAGAAIVLFGAFYALFFALGRLWKSRAMTLTGTICYLALAGSCAVLVHALALSGIWTLVVIVMLLGYFALPRAIWHLCDGTHGESGQATPASTPAESRLA